MSRIPPIGLRIASGTQHFNAIGISKYNYVNQLKNYLNVDHILPQMQQQLIFSVLSKKKTRRNSHISALSFFQLGSMPVTILLKAKQLFCIQLLNSRFFFNNKTIPFASSRFLLPSVVRPNETTQHRILPKIKTKSNSMFKLLKQLSTELLNNNKKHLINKKSILNKNSYQTQEKWNRRLLVPKLVKNSLSLLKNSNSNKKFKFFLNFLLQKKFNSFYFSKIKFNRIQQLLLKKNKTKRFRINDHTQKFISNGAVKLCNLAFGFISKTKSQFSTINHFEVFSDLSIILSKIKNNNQLLCNPNKFNLSLKKNKAFHVVKKELKNQHFASSAKKPNVIKYSNAKHNHIQRQNIWLLACLSRLIKASKINNLNYSRPLFLPCGLNNFDNLKNVNLAIQSIGNEQTNKHYLITNYAQFSNFIIKLDREKKITPITTSLLQTTKTQFYANLPTATVGTKFLINKSFNTVQGLHNFYLISCRFEKNNFSHTLYNRLTTQKNSLICQPTYSIPGTTIPNIISFETTNHVGKQLHSKPRIEKELKDSDVAHKSGLQHFLSVRL